MNGFIWWFFGCSCGVACGVAMGYEELEKKIKSRLHRLSQTRNIKFFNEDGEELQCQTIIAYLFPKKRKK